MLLFILTGTFCVLAQWNGIKRFSFARVALLFERVLRFDDRAVTSVRDVGGGGKREHANFVEHWVFPDSRSANHDGVSAGQANLLIAMLVVVEVQHSASLKSSDKRENHKTPRFRSIDAVGNKP